MSNTDELFLPFTGEWKRPIDDKRRITIPAKWRFSGDDKDSSYLAIPTSYGAISVFPPDMIRSLHEKISKISIANPAKRKGLMRLMSKSDKFGCDKQGRININESLKAHSGLSKEVLLIGGGASFEIWDPEKYEEWMQTDIENPEESTPEDLGI